MTICVFGLWHLGCVNAACVAEHYQTIGLDPSPSIVSDLRTAKPPILEPGLSELIQAGLSKGTLRFTSDPREALEAADVVWVTFDTPVNEADESDFEYVEAQVATLFPHLRDSSIVLISSQMPVGSTARIARHYKSEHPGISVTFAYSPENLRLGRAVEIFRAPGRIVVGVRSQDDRNRLETVLTPFCQNLLWMSVESAEMTKHGLNAYLANSIAFMNEVSTLCEAVGADAKEVEHGLKSDERIGPRAYLSPGGPFAGGTLARDLATLTSMARRVGVTVPLLASIQQSNEIHKSWSRRKLESLLGSVAGKKISILGLAYKPGTDTLRRSAAIELCRWLCSQQATVRAFDPAVKQIPEGLRPYVRLCTSAIEAVEGTDAVVVATEWPVFRELRGQDLVAKMRNPVVLDASRFLERSLNIAPPLRYVAVGKPARVE